MSFSDPVNGAGTLYADSVFQIIGSGISNGSKTATFTTKSGISDSNGVIRYQSFVVTAIGVPTNQIEVTFDGNNIGPVAVPEPLTLLGAITAVGFGAAFKRRSLKSVSVV
ncbi:MAG: PEP-CTERM sorting domain-containing protein [Snowella sp.]